uniref:Mobile element protein n=1 Tax=Nonomuraea gerenzanensis TaxID=93944 RepID=A0A1M4EFI5_9ACTN|nr:Mobile element protein [Nonomuraea gerenzanensis]
MHPPDHAERADVELTTGPPASTGGPVVPLAPRHYLRLNSWCRRADGLSSVRYHRSRRYPQGGGLTAERQQFREELRLKAAERFAQGEASSVITSVIAKALRVNVRSVQRWRQKWGQGGPRALRSRGPTSLPRLGQEQFAQLEAELAKGPTAHGWEDQRWTLARIKTVIGRRFHMPTRSRACGNCWRVTAGPGRSRPDGRWSGTTGWWPGGSRRCGPARKTRGGPWALARLRGRSRILHDAAAREDLVTARPDPGGAGWPRRSPCSAGATAGSTAGASAGSTAGSTAGGEGRGPVRDCHSDTATTTATATPIVRGRDPPACPATTLPIVAAL